MATAQKADGSIIDLDSATFAIQPSSGVQPTNSVTPPYAPMTTSTSQTASGIIPAVVTNLKETRTALANARSVQESAIQARNSAQKEFDTHTLLLETQENIEARQSEINLEQANVQKLQEIVNRQGFGRKFFRSLTANGRAINKADNAELNRLHPGTKLSKANLTNAIGIHKSAVIRKTNQLDTLNTQKANYITALTDLGFTDPLDTIDQIKTALNNSHEKLNNAKIHANEAEEEISRLETLESQFEKSEFRKSLLIAGGIGLAATTALVTFLPASATLATVGLGAALGGTAFAIPTLLGSSLSSNISNFISHRDWLMSPIKLSVGLIAAGASLFAFNDPAVANSLADYGLNANLSNLLPDINFGPASPYIEATKEWLGSAQDWVANRLSDIQSSFSESTQIEPTNPALADPAIDAHIAANAAPEAGSVVAEGTTNPALADPAIDAHMAANAAPEAGSVVAETLNVDNGPGQFIPVTVEPCDNLWSITADHFNLPNTPENAGDIQRLTDSVATFNGMVENEANGLSVGTTIHMPNLPTEEILQNHTSLTQDWQKLVADIADGNGPDQMWGGHDQNVTASSQDVGLRPQARPVVPAVS